MNVEDKIAKLEGLLERVNQRAGAPRVASPAMPARAATPAPAPVAKIDAKIEMKAATPTPAPVEVEVSTPTPQPAVAQAKTTPPQVAAPDFAMDEPDAELEVSTEVVDVDVDMDEVDMDEVAAIEAAERAAKTSPPVELEVVEDEEPPPLTEENVRVAPANELEEPAPSSSPRPIETAEAEAFEDESAPRHTPPPESGKQVAAASSHPPPSSVPPPSSLGGHTLIGGWREPGLPGQGPPIIGPGAMGSPVRVPAPATPAAPPPAAPQAPPPRPAAPAAVPAAQASGTRLSPEVTKAELPGAAKVATFEGAAPSFKPSSFGDLVDATLAL